MKKVFVELEELRRTGQWEYLCDEDFKINSESNDETELLKLVNEKVDFLWNDALSAYEQPRRATKIVSVEPYIDHMPIPMDVEDDFPDGRDFDDEWHPDSEII